MSTKKINRSEIFIVIILCAVFIACGFAATYTPFKPPSPTATVKLQESLPPASASHSSNPTIANPTPTTQATQTPTAVPEPAEISIMAVGDIMFHAPIIEAGKIKGAGNYNFDYSFQYIKSIISSADLAMGNFECTLGGSPYSGENAKSFSAPDAAADAIKNAGFDVLCTANNHAYDRGDSGLLRTVKVMREKGLVCIGTREDVSEKPYTIVDVKGIKVGMTAYTYGARPGGTGVALNGLKLGKSTRNLVNVFQPSDATKELDKMTQVVRDMHADGADVVLFFMHWGIEDSRTPNSVQKKLAQGLADAGVDIIFASHPHVLQNVDVIDSQISGKKTAVIYSLGNFISNQRTQYNPDWTYTEDGMIADVKVVKNFDTGKAEVSSLEYLPTWTFMYNYGGLRRYTVVPLDQAMASPKDFGITQQRDVKKTQKSFSNTQELMKDAVSAGKITLMDSTK